MYAYCFTIAATHEKYRPSTLDPDVSTRYLLADSYGQALAFIHEDMTRAGWTIQETTCKEVYIHDIRKKG